MPLFIFAIIFAIIISMMMMRRLMIFAFTLVFFRHAIIYRCRYILFRHFSDAISMPSFDAIIADEFIYAA